MNLLIHEFGSLLSFISHQFINVIRLGCLNIKLLQLFHQVISEHIVIYQYLILHRLKLPKQLLQVFVSKLIRIDQLDDIIQLLVSDITILLFVYLLNTFEHVYEPIVIFDSLQEVTHLNVICLSLLSVEFTIVPTRVHELLIFFAICVVINTLIDLFYFGCVFYG
jgi:hypothetical protein